MVCYLIDYHKCEFICTTITQNELEYYWHQKNPSTRSSLIVTSSPVITIFVTKH